MSVSGSQTGSRVTLQSGPSPADLAVQRAEQALLRLQDRQGLWRFDLESDPGITADYVLMMHFVDEVDEVLQRKIATYLRSRQSDDGGWPLYYGGPSDLGCSVKAYYSLKLAGDRPELPHMEKARTTILALGGAARASVFVRTLLALFQQMPWHGVPLLL